MQIKKLSKQAGKLTGRTDDKLLTLLLVYGGPRIGEATAPQVRSFDHERSHVEGQAPDDFIFQSARGKAINERNWYNRVWLKTREVVPVAACYSIHDLRHVAATLAIGAGADVKLVQQMLGHKDATETLNTYAALWGDRVDEVARCVEKNRTKALRKAAKDRAATSDAEGV